MFDIGAFFAGYDAGVDYREQAELLRKKDEEYLHEQYRLHRAMGEKALKSTLKTNHQCINCGAPYEPVCSYCGSKS